MTMWISATTYGIESIIFVYTNGASLTVTFQRHHGVTQYHLPRSATMVAKFPSYSGSAQIVYGAYRLINRYPRPFCAALGGISSLAVPRSSIGVTCPDIITQGVRAARRDTPCDAGQGGWCPRSRTP